MFWRRTKTKQAQDPGPDAVPPELQDWARDLDLTGLTDETARSIGKYLREYQRMRPTVRHEVGFRMLATIAAQVSPPPPPHAPLPDIIATVLAVRRLGEQAGTA